MEFFGKSPIRKFDYIIAKISFFSLVFLILKQYLDIMLYDYKYGDVSIIVDIGGILIIIGILIILAGMINMWSSLRMGLPRKKTKLRTDGLFRISRNPIYVGFLFIDFGALFYIYDFIVVVIVLSILSAIYHHRIILGEEKFLEKTFGKEYMEYKSKVRRYL